ncbi:sugar transferase [Caloramator sp. E03]|uniref:sugar transferase n=1 Tax=Caloramator sp. E03 TaxID=2576307 RepID=UPI0011101226|nr:sugar transferase [Caloramator sp. E03]QCX34860.1 sugar transferase [Caloramator sp. E03]
MEIDVNGKIESAVINQPSQLYFFIKRILDIILSFVGIILCLPIFLVISIAIIIDSPGNPFFSHKRLGLNGKIIKVYKFRSMYKNAEEMLKKLTPEQKKEFEENFKLKDDPRITKVGAFLRKTSLDELPQLFNILIGNMTIVGPRPIVEKELEKYGIYAEKFLSAKPGLTGLWQVSGRSDTTYEERVMLDMEYIDNRSILNDIIIIFKTILVVFKKSGAY